MKGYTTKSLQTLELDRIRIYNEEQIDAWLMQRMKPDEQMLLLVDSDAMARRNVLTCFGVRRKFEFRAPETWWQHVKLALRIRWPRVFRWLIVRYRVAQLDTFAVLADVPEQIMASRLVIPYSDAKPRLHVVRG